MKSTRSILTRVFTPEEVEQIIEGGLLDEEGNYIFNTVYTETVRHDRDKNSTDVEYVIHDVANDRYYKTELLDSVWIHQAEHNASRTWTEVFPRQITTTIYE